MKSTTQVVIGSVAAGVLFLMIGAYLDRPTVEISMSGHCVNAYGPRGPMSCKMAMGMSHEVVFVDTHKFKKVLSDQKQTAI